MAISIRLVQKHEAEDVEMGAPFNCIMALMPLTAKLDAQYADKVGQVQGSDRDGGVRYKISATETLKANEWILPKLVKGWDGLKFIDDEGTEKALEYDEEIVKAFAGDKKLVEPILEKCRELAGRHHEEDEKNSDD